MMHERRLFSGYQMTRFPRALQKRASDEITLRVVVFSPHFSLRHTAARERGRLFETSPLVGGGRLSPRLAPFSEGIPARSAPGLSEPSGPLRLRVVAGFSRRRARPPQFGDHVRACLQDDMGTPCCGGGARSARGDAEFSAADFFQ